MKVRLLRDARVRRKAGETVEVTPAEAAFLLSIGSAEAVDPASEAVEIPEKSTAKAETPEKPTRRSRKK